MVQDLSALAGKVRVVNSRLRGGERVSSFEYGMPMGKETRIPETLGSSIPACLMVVARV